MTKVRCLTDDGIRAFGRYLQRLREGGRIPPPRFLLDDPRYSRASAFGEVTVEPRNFVSRRAFAEYMDGQFRAAGLFADADENGLWEWLSLYYFDAASPMPAASEAPESTAGIC